MLVAGGDWGESSVAVMNVERTFSMIKPDAVAAGQAGEILGWRPSVPWTETLRAVLEDWRARVAAKGREA